MVCSIILAAGIGSRVGGSTPKQFIMIDGKPLVVHTIESISESDVVDEVCVVCRDGWIDEMRRMVDEYGLRKVRHIIKGGPTGFMSTYEGIRFVHFSEDVKDKVVMVHDGNRPFVTPGMIEKCYETFKAHGNGVSAIPCVEVLFESEDGVSSSKGVDRDRIVKTQTPQFYSTEDVYPLYEAAVESGNASFASTTELLVRNGREVFFSEGSGENIKVTYPEDLAIADALLKYRTERGL